MGIVKARGVTKKLGPVSLGRKFLRFKTRNSNRQFAIHEDLISASSKYFKDRLQKSRKEPTGECAICHEDFDLREDDVAFCAASCGQNIHEKCIEQWRQRSAGPLACPLCRKAWKVQSEDLVKLEQDLDSSAVQLYLDWLYTQQLRIPEELDREDEEFCVFLLKAWTVSEVLRDDQFRYAIIAEYVSSVHHDDTIGFWTDAIEYAYSNDGSESMRNFLVDELLAGAGLDESFWLIDYSTYLPPPFMRDMCQTMFKRMKEKPSYKMVLKTHTKRKYELIESDEEEEDEDDEGV